LILSYSIGKRETYLSQKLEIINVVVTAAKEAIPMSCHQRLLLQTRQNVFRILINFALTVFYLILQLFFQ
jgi:hypothetical protein